MKISRFLSILLIMILLTSCNVNSKENNNTTYISNESMRKVAYTDGFLYYMNQDNLVKKDRYTSSESVILPDVDIIFQNESEIFCVQSTGDTPQNKLYEIIDGAVSFICDLPDGAFVDMTGNEEYLWFIVNTQLFCIDIGTKEIQTLSDGNERITDIVFSNGKLYYILFTGNLLEDEQEPETFYSKEQIERISFDSEIWSYDIDTKNKKRLEYAGDAGVIMTPVQEGIVYYQVNTHQIKYVQKTKKATIIAEELVTGLFSDNQNNIYYGKLDNAIYKLNIKTKKSDAIYQGKSMFNGITPQQIYLSDGTWVEY